MSGISIHYGWFFRYLYLLTAFAAVCAGQGIFNGGFELTDPNGGQSFSTPLGWTCTNYATQVYNFLPSYSGKSDNPFQWKIDYKRGLFPFEGNYFLMLSTGPDPNGTLYTSVSDANAIQEVRISSGQMIQGMYFFGTCDYLVWDDTATIVLKPKFNPDLKEIPLVSVSVHDVGDNSSTLGWQRFKYIFDANQTGTYNLIIDVNDQKDHKFNSYFAVDALSLCDAPVTNSDINLDCTVNLLDFSILAYDWLGDCTVVNYSGDPNNSGCFIGTDLDDSGYVDANDLRIFSQDWLSGY